jgi:hypothetical protein
MKSLYLAWAAVVADLGIFVSPLSMSHSGAALLSLWCLHAGACAVLATATYLLLPRRYQQPRWAVWLLMADFAFVAPVLGAVGLLLLVHSSLRRTEERARRAVPVGLELPEYDVAARDVKRAGQGAIRARLVANVPNATRMQSLLMLQAVPKSVANPILDQLLGDGTDDVRLLAFGMLESEEKALSVHIHRERKTLEGQLTPRQRFDCLSSLAWLHWEMIYASLAQGELRKHILGEALRYADAAIAEAEQPNASIIFLRARILLARDDLDAAQAGIAAAVELGQPESATLPYLAEIAFRRRQFPQVRALLGKLGSQYVTARTQAVVDLWTGRDHVTLPDRRVLPHI